MNSIGQYLRDAIQKQLYAQWDTNNPRFGVGSAIPDKYIALLLDELQGDTLTIESENGDTRTAAMLVVDESSSRIITEQAIASRTVASGRFKEHYVIAVRNAPHPIPFVVAGSQQLSNTTTLDHLSDPLPSLKDHLVRTRCNTGDDTHFHNSLIDLIAWTAQHNAPGVKLTPNEYEWHLCQRIAENFPGNLTPFKSFLACLGHVCCEPDQLNTDHRTLLKSIAERSSREGLLNIFDELSSTDLAEESDVSTALLECKAHLEATAGDGSIWHRRLHHAYVPMVDDENVVADWWTTLNADTWNALGTVVAPSPTTKLNITFEHDHFFPTSLGAVVPSSNGLSCYVDGHSEHDGGPIEWERCLGRAVTQLPDETPRIEQLDVPSHDGPIHLRARQGEKDGRSEQLVCLDTFTPGCLLDVDGASRVTIPKRQSL